MRPYRKDKVASAVQTVVSEVIAHRMNDPRIEPFTTVTRVEMTGDLLFATIYLSIPGGEAAERRTLTAIRHATGHIKKAIAGAVPLRQCPDVRFELDEQVRRTREVLALLEENRKNHPELFPSEDTEELSEAEAEDADEAEEDDGERPLEEA